MSGEASILIASGLISLTAHSINCWGKRKKVKKLYKTKLSSLIISKGCGKTTLKQSLSALTSDLVIVDMSTSLRMHNFIIMKTGSEKMKEIILEKFNEALEQTDSPKRYVEIADDQVLLESGLDSLGFAILVALLEEELDFDPFQEMENAVYPTTFGDFVAIYEQRKA